MLITHTPRLEIQTLATSKNCVLYSTSQSYNLIGYYQRSKRVHGVFSD